MPQHGTTGPFHFLGKTCLGTKYVNGIFAGEYAPTVFDNFYIEVDIGGENAAAIQRKVGLGIWDTAGQEEYDRIRPMAYPNTVLYSLINCVNCKIPIKM